MGINGDVTFDGHKSHFRNFKDCFIKSRNSVKSSNSGFERTFSFKIGMKAVMKRIIVHEKNG